MNTVIFAFDPANFNPADFLKWGQMGLALAMAIMGWQLFKRAADDGKDGKGGEARIAAKSRNALMFMISGVVLFVFSLIGEIILKLNPPAVDSIRAKITVPPLTEEDVDTYGKNMVHGAETPVLACTVPQDLLIKSGTTLLIDLNPFAKAYTRLQSSKAILENNLTKHVPGLGGGDGTEP